MPETTPLSWTTEQRAISDLTEHPNNPRWLSDDQHKQLTDSLQKFGLVEIPAINTDGMILAGHQRIRILKEQGQAAGTIEVRVPSRLLTPEEVDEYLIRSNKNTGSWDWDKLADAFETNDLIDWGFNEDEIFGETGDDPHATSEGQEDDYEIPEEIETDIEPGDLIKIGPHRLICGDSRSPSSWERMLGPQGLAQAVVTDPPYNVDYHNADGQGMANDKMDDIAYRNFLEDALKAMAARLEMGRACYVWHADSEGHHVRAAYLAAGLDLKQCLVWVKDTLVMGRSDYQWRHEPCLYGWKPGAAHYFTPERNRTTVVEDEDFNPDVLKKAELIQLVKDLLDETPHSVILADKPRKNHNHPTVKPIPVIAKQIINSTRHGELVLDGFLGSGTTMLAAHQTGRVCYGTELSPQYCQVIIDRMAAAVPDYKAIIEKPKKK